LEEEVKEMPEAIPSYPRLEDEPLSFWGEDEYDFPDKRLNAKSYTTQRCRIYRFPVVFDTDPEMTKVEGPIWETSPNDLTETLESDLVQGVQKPDTKHEMNIEFCLDAASESETFVSFLSDDQPTQITEMDEECLRFCHDHELTTVVDNCLERAVQTFPGIIEISPEFDLFEEDDEDDMGHVVIRVKVKAEQASVQEQYDQWLDWFVDNVDDASRSLVTLTVSRIR
jgi:hypothetical protein